MRKTIYRRFDGVTDTHGRSDKYGNVREYKETVVTYTWNKNEELVYRYISMFFPDLKEIVLEPNLLHEPIGVFLRAKNDKIELKTKCCHGIPYNDLNYEYEFTNKTYKKLALLQIIGILKYLKNIRKLR